MNTQGRVLSYFGKIKSIDWKLLLFLVLFMDVKLVVKLLAIVVIYLLQPNLRFGFGFKRSRLPLFYLLTLAIALLDLFLYQRFSDTHYLVSFLTGACFWIACILALHQVKLFTEKRDRDTIIRTLIVFFILNALAAYGEYARIVIETGSINPYRYQGDHQKYFISTGDYIKGISFDTSVTNAALNALGVLFFLYLRRMAMVLLCMSVLLMTASNLTLILLVAVLLYVFIFNSSRDQKSMITACLFLLIIFLVKISPQNNQYLAESYEKLTGGEKPIKPFNKEIPLIARPDSVLTPAERKQKIALLYLDNLNQVKQKQPAKQAVFASLEVAPGSTDRPVLPQANIHTEPYQNRDEMTPTRIRLLDFMQANNIPPLPAGKTPGKLIAALQTIDFLHAHPSRILTGNGMGTFSSKLAFKSAALGIAGGYPERFRYIDPAFAGNHLQVYLSFFSKSPKLHSVVHAPNSVYLQLAGEYGLAGLLALLLCYLGYFLKRIDLKSYGLPVLLLLAGILLTDYWFEQLSVIPVFELILLLSCKQKSTAA